jgi:predicted ester cyclase
MFRSASLPAAAVLGALSTITAATSADAAAELSEAKVRSIIAPFYDALNQPARKDVAALLAQSTSPDWMSCGGNDVCVPRERVIAGFRSRGEGVPDLAWKIVDVIVAGDRVIVRGEATGTPKTPFFGVAPNGKSFRVMSIDVHTIANDKMVRSFHIEDWAGAVRQLTSE